MTDPDLITDRHPQLQAQAEKEAILDSRNRGDQQGPQRPEGDLLRQPVRVGPDSKGNKIRHSLANFFQIQSVHSA